MRRDKTAAAALGSVLALVLAGCNRNEAAQPARVQRDDGGTASSSRDGGGRSGGYDGASYRRGSDRGGGSSGGGDYEQAARPRAAIPDFKGKPMWSDKRRHSAQENAQYQFDHHGEDFGARTLNDYLGKVHDFADHPPAAAETITRANGDKLIYDAKTNVFAVVRRDGAPRTAFKPQDGADYWKKQQARAQDERSSGGGRSSYRQDRSGDQG